MSTREHSIEAPTWSMIFFRSLFVITIASFAFASYSLIRPLFGTFGFDLATCLKSAGAVLALGIFVVWLIPMVDLHISIFEHVIPRRRFRQGRCAQCGHSRSPDMKGRSCSECGRPHEEPDGWRLRGGTILNFVIWLSVGLLVGSAVAETRLTLDERRWVVECRTLEEMSADSLGFRARPRSWPSSYSELYYRTGQGTYAEPLVTNQRMDRSQRSETRSRTETSFYSP